MAKWKPPHPFEKHESRNFKKELERLEYFDKVCDFLGMPKIETQYQVIGWNEFENIQNLIGHYKHHEWRYLAHEKLGDNQWGFIVYRPMRLKDRIWLLGFLAQDDIRWKYNLDRKDGITKLDWEEYFRQRVNEFYEEMEPLPKEYRTKK